MENKAGMKAVPESFARLAVNKIEPQRTLRARRVMGIRLGMEAITEPFTLSACLAVN